jgi:phosphoglycolate phosphatase
MKDLTLVFDLDGTLVDTAPDLVAATNHVLEYRGRAPIDGAALRAFVGHGALRMIEEALGADGRQLGESELHELFERFLAYYEANIAVESRPFDGVLAALDRYAEAGTRLAVCTNKSERLARHLLDKLGMSSRFAAITGRDTFDVFKPDPGHLLGTIRLAGGDRARAVMIGDSNVDIATAKAARVPVVAVSFGYSPSPVDEFNPDAIIDHYDQLEDTVVRLTGMEAGTPAP